MNQYAGQKVIVSAVITNKQGAVLLLERGTGDRYLSEDFELPGGVVAAGENFERALARSLSDQLGLQPKLMMYLKSITGVAPSGVYIKVYFRVQVTRQEKLTSSTLHHSVRWVTTDEVGDITPHGDIGELFSEMHGTDDKKVDKKTTYIVHSDGGSRGNPGPSAAAYVIETVQGDVVARGGEYIGVATNNLAEYTGVLLALKALEHHASPSDSVKCYLDSTLVVNQLSGEYKIKNRDLWPIHQAVIATAKSFQSVQYIHIARELNQAADARVNAILDTHTVIQKD